MVLKIFTDQNKLLVRLGARPFSSPKQVQSLRGKKPLEGQLPFVELVLGPCSERREDSEIVKSEFDVW